jgi:hypothetical protein
MRFANGRYELSTANSGTGGVDRMKAYHSACFDDREQLCFSGNWTKIRAKNKEGSAPSQI